jgi:toxin ParE1/3/4
MGKFRLSNAAKDDLKRIAIYTDERWGKEQRNSYLRQLDNRFHRIAENPSIGKPCDYLKSGYRKAAEGSHIIFYKVTQPDSVDIIRILHRNSDVENYL